jgi:hypothetical protein
MFFGLVIATLNFILPLIGASFVVAFFQQILVISRQP